jgi:hypothetical protein
MNTVITRIPEMGAKEIVARYSAEIVDVCRTKLDANDPAQREAFAEIREILTKLHHDTTSASNYLSNMVEQLR